MTTENLKLETVSAIVWTDDDGTTYRRVWTDDGPQDIECTAKGDK